MGSRALKGTACVGFNSTTSVGHAHTLVKRPNCYNAISSVFTSKACVGFSCETLTAHVHKRGLVGSTLWLPQCLQYRFHRLSKESANIQNTQVETTAQEVVRIYLLCNKTTTSYFSKQLTQHCLKLGKLRKEIL